MRKEEKKNGVEQDDIPEGTKIKLKEEEEQKLCGARISGSEQVGRCGRRTFTKGTDD